MDGLSGKGNGAPASAGRRLPGPAPDADRLRDVLQRALAGILEGEVSLAGQLFLHSIGDADAPRLRQCLKPRGDVDAIPEQVAVLHDNVTDVDADAEHDAALGRDLPLMDSSSLPARRRHRPRHRQRSQTPRLRHRPSA